MKRILFFTLMFLFSLISFANTNVFNGGIRTSNPARVYGNQELKTGQTIKLQNEKDIILPNITIPKNTIIYGILDFKEYRAFVNIENIVINEELIKVNLLVYGYDTILGIPLDLKKRAEESGPNLKVTFIDNTKIILLEALPH